MDDLEAYVAERAKKEPDFPDLVKAAEERLIIAKALAKARQDSKLSQTQVAAKMATSPSVVSRIEGGADVRLSSLQKYAGALGQELSIQLVKPKRKAARKRTRTASSH